MNARISLVGNACSYEFHLRSCHQNFTLFTMRTSVFSLVCFLAAITGFAQSVMNVRAFEEDGNVMIIYDLYTTKPQSQFYVTLKMSKDGGKIYTPIFETAGDANKNVKVGSEHSIVWHPVQMPTDSMIFKVEAGPRRSDEQMANPNADKFFQHAAGTVKIVKVARLNSDIEFTFTLRNLRDKNNIFIAANFNILDDKNQRYTKVIVSQNEKAANVISCEPDSNISFKITVSGVPANVKVFNTVAFSLSEIPVKFDNVIIEQ
jgi:hypothetical protein